MKMLLPGLVGLALFTAQPASAVSVLGNEYPGFANQLLDSGGGVFTDLGTNGWSANATDIANAAADSNPATFVVGTTENAFVELGFSVPVIDGPGDDLGFFFVGADGHNFTVELFSDATSSGVSSLSLEPQAGYTGFVTSTYPDEGIYSMTADIGALGATGPVDRIRLGIGDGNTADSAVASLVVAENVVPVPAAVWLFGTGLIALVGFARRCRT
jgi:hypothetical protein